MNSEPDLSRRIFEEFSPDDFEFAAATPCWIQPCWINVSSTFRASNARAKDAFPLPIKFDFQTDPFARKRVLEQFNSQFWQLYDKARIGGRAWIDFLWKQFDNFRQAFERTGELFQPPMRFVPRTEFQNATLDIILQHDPEAFEIYLADDTDSSKNEILVLRIHSSLWHYSPGQMYFWFDKRVPWRIRAEDVLPWFDATVKKLPKKRQPMDWMPWKNKFLQSHPEFSRALAVSHVNWEERPPLVLVFGTKDQVGYAGLFHLDRSRIQAIRRSRNEISIKATIENRYENDPEKLQWTFRIFSPTTRHAERLESRLISGEEIHFGLGDDITGMIATNDRSIHFINVDPELIKRSYSRKGMMLLSLSPPRFRHKIYSYYDGEAALPDDVHRI